MERTLRMGWATGPAAARGVGLGMRLVACGDVSTLGTPLDAVAGLLAHAGLPMCSRAGVDTWTLPDGANLRVGAPELHGTADGRAWTLRLPLATAILEEHQVEVPGLGRFDGASLADSVDASSVCPGLFIGWKLLRFKSSYEI